jgi:hypothetical protein
MFNRALANRQLLTYFFIGMTGSNHRDNIVFSRGKPMPLVRGFCLTLWKVSAQHLNKDPNSICTQPILVRQDAADALEHYLWRRGFWHDAASSQPQSLNDVSFINNGCEQNDPHCRPGAHCAIDETGQRRVNEEDVRLEVLPQGDQPRPIGSFSDDIEAGLRLERSKKTGAAPEIRSGDHNPGRRCVSGH